MEISEIPLFSQFLILLLFYSLRSPEVFFCFFYFFPFEGSSSASFAFRLQKVLPFAEILQLKKAWLYD